MELAASSGGDCIVFVGTEAGIPGTAIGHEKGRHISVEVQSSTFVRATTIAVETIRDGNGGDLGKSSPGRRSREPAYALPKRQTKSHGQRDAAVPGQTATRGGENFQPHCREVVRTLVGDHVRERVKKVGHLHLAELGDIDVLALDKNRNRIIVIECKDLSVARTPHELANEVKELLHSGNDVRSEVAKHQDRVSWVKQHVSEVLAFFGIRSTKGWKVASLVVVDQPLMTAHLSTCPVTVLTVTELEKGLP